MSRDGIVHLGAKALRDFAQEHNPKIWAKAGTLQIQQARVVVDAVYDEIAREVREQVTQEVRDHLVEEMIIYGHCDMGFTVDGKGPATGPDVHHYQCWCPAGAKCPVYPRRPA